jgi:hypothetical protein
LKLYHFTYEGALAAILSEGLTKGDVPLTQTTGVNAVWFTTDPSPDGHGVYAARTQIVTPEESAALSHCFGQHIPAGTVIPWVDKHKIRIRVDLETSRTPGLYKWLDFAKAMKIDRDWLKCLHAGNKPHTWWLWPATMPPERFKAIEVRSEIGNVPLWENLDLLSADVRDALLAGERRAA